MYRYCPECDQWYETAEYTVDETGETVCRQDDHGAVHGSLQFSTYDRKSYITEREFKRQNPQWYQGREDMLAAAKRQGLVQ